MIKYNNQYSENEKKKIWEDAFIVFDTSALCRFYGLTSEAWIHLHSILSNISDRIWISNRVWVEFSRHKDEERKKPLGNYGLPSFIKKSHFVSEFDGFLKELRISSHQHPYFSENQINKLESLHKESKELFEKIRVFLEKSLKNQKLELQKQLDDDPINDFISSLQKGEAYSYQQLLEIANEGTWRYANMIPPGFEDKDKESIDRFGDLILWLQTIEEASKRNKSVIFVTQDLKRDWNNIESDEHLEPREELIQEFESKTNQKILFYTISDFLQEYAEIGGLQEMGDKTFSNLLRELILQSIPNDCIKIEIEETGEILGVSSDEIDWDWEEEVIDEREMGSEIVLIHTAYLTSELGNSFNLCFKVYQYPIGSINYIEVEGEDCEILYKPDLYNFIEFPNNPSEACCRCGEWRYDINEDGFCSECMDEFRRMIDKD